MLKTKPNEIEILNHPQAPCEAPETAEGLRRGLWQAWLRSLLLFCCASVYVELCLHLSSIDRWTGGRSIWCCSDCWVERSAHC